MSQRHFLERSLKKKNLDIQGKFVSVPLRVKSPTDHVRSEPEHRGDL